MKEALQQHPFIAGERLRAVQQRVTGEGKNELSLLFQTVEGESLRIATEALAVSGLETGALDADGLFARPVRPLPPGQTAQQAIAAALDSVHALVLERLQMSVTIMELEKDTQWLYDGTESIGTDEAQPHGLAAAGGDDDGDGDTGSEPGFTGHDSDDDGDDNDLEHNLHTEAEIKKEQTDQEASANSRPSRCRSAA